MKSNGEHKKTWVFYLNYFFLQLFFIRLFRAKKDKQTETKAFGVMGFILPFTGWSETNPYLRFWKFSLILVRVEKVIA